MPTQNVPVLGFDTELLLRAQAIRLVCFDVDGVMTDGSLWISGDAGFPTGAHEHTKRFHTLDGLGLKLLQGAGIQVVVISGRDSPALRGRLAALGLHQHTLGTEHKRPALEAWMRDFGLDWSVVAAMGDDWPDLPLLCRAALAVAPPTAHPEVLARVHHITRMPAGSGAVRECCDLLLMAGQHYRSLLDKALG